MTSKQHSRVLGHHPWCIPLSQEQVKVQTTVLTMLMIIHRQELRSEDIYKVWTIVLQRLSDRLWRLSHQAIKVEPKCYKSWATKFSCLMVFYYFSVCSICMPQRFGYEEWCMSYDLELQRLSHNSNLMVGP